MADIIIKGESTTVTLERHQDSETFETFYMINCDRGAWCHYGPWRPRTVWNMAEAVEYAEMHADSVH